MDRFTCRLCGSWNQITAHRLPCQKERYIRDIKRALDIDLTLDTASHPAFICQACRLKLSRWRKAINNKKIAVINIIPFEHACGINWEQVKESATTLCLTFFEEDNKKYFMQLVNECVAFTVCFDTELNCSITVQGKTFPLHRILNIEEKKQYSTTDDIQFILSQLSRTKLCPGNNDFNDVCRYRTSELAVFFGSDGTVKAREEVSVIGTTVRTVNCSLICSEQRSRCSLCEVYRTSLFQCRSRAKKSINSELKPNHRLDYMSSNQLREKYLMSCKENRDLKREIKRLQSKCRTLQD